MVSSASSRVSEPRGAEADERCGEDLTSNVVRRTYASLFSFVVVVVLVVELFME